MVMSSSCGLIPSPTESAPCGSKSTSSTLRPYSASAAPRLMLDVVLPTPPFWLHIAMIVAGPCRSSGAGSGKIGIGRPVGPSLFEISARPRRRSGPRPSPVFDVLRLPGRCPAAVLGHGGAHGRQRREGFAGPGGGGSASRIGSRTLSFRAGRPPQAADPLSPRTGFAGPPCGSRFRFPHVRVTFLGTGAACREGP